MPQQIILRKGTAAAWTSAGSVVLAAGEPGFETDTGKFKIGNGTQAWTALPYAVGTIPVNLADLADVASTAPSTGQVLKWNGTAWEPAADSTGGGTGATYAISAETATGGVNLRLTGSDASTDDVKFEAGSGITVTRTDANTITVASSVTDTDTTYTISNQAAGSDISIDLTASDGPSASVTLQAGTNISYDSINSGTFSIGAASYAVNTTQETSGGGATYSQSQLTRTLNGTSNSESTLLVKSLDNNLVVTAAQVGATSTITIANPSRVNPASTGTGEVAFYSAGASSTILNPQSVLSVGSVTETVNIAGNLIITRDSYSASSQAGFLFRQHHATADAVGVNFYRSRGVNATPTTVVSGDDIIDFGFLSHDGTNVTASAGLSVITTGTISTGIVPAKFQFTTRNQAGVFAARVEISAEGVLQCNTFANLSGSDITFSPSGVVRLPAGSTVGGVLIGSIVIKGTVATSASLPGGAAAGDSYVALSPTPTHLWTWNGSAWVDLGEFQGPAGTNGTNGQGVPTGGTVGQVLAKIDSSNYNTQWSTLATVATSGLYSDLSGSPTIPSDLTDLGITDGTPGQVLTTDGAGVFTFSTVTSGSGDVVGPATATNNALARYDLTTGKLLKNSLITVSDTGAITAPSVGSVIPFYFADQAAFPAASTYHGAVVHSHADGKMYFAHSGTWNALANASEIVANTDTTYSIKATTAIGGATLDLDAGGSGSGTDSVTFAGGTGITVSRTDANTITVASSVTDTNTTYSINAIDGTTGKKIIRLTAGGSGSGDDDVVLVAGTNVTLDRTGDEITINSTASGGGVGLGSRADVTGTTGSIADGATGNIAITGYKAYALLKMVVEHEAWVRIYTDTASRTADASRAEGVDPTPGSGVIAEVITTSAPQTILISPGTIGFNNEGTPATSIPIAVTNKSGTTRTITVTLTVLQLEA
jgi:hypothetical protein